MLVIDSSTVEHGIESHACLLAPDRSSTLVIIDKLGTQVRARIVAALVKGNSIRATCRMTGYAKNTVIKLLVDLGGVCSAYQDQVTRDLPCKRPQCDDVWLFCYAKQKNVAAVHRVEFGYGDMRTWTAIDADTKLVPTWLVGGRSSADAADFIEDLASHLANRVQLTTDGHKPYLEAGESAFGADIDYAMLFKLYGPAPSSEKRHGPAEDIRAETRRIIGDTDPMDISTSDAERQNLTMRISMRRFTRLTNAFSTTVENLAHAVSLHFMHYNFCRVHMTLKRTPAMAAGIADHAWSIE